MVDALNVVESDPADRLVTGEIVAGAAQVFLVHIAQLVAFAPPSQQKVPFCLSMAKRRLDNHLEGFSMRL